MQGFQEKLNEQLRGAMSNWWNNMSKEEILEYLASQEQVTADYLRTMLANEGIVIQLGTAFTCHDNTVETAV